MLRFVSLFIFLLTLIGCKKKATIVGNLPQILSVKVPHQHNSIPILILDAGHGGNDPGGINDSLQLYEKNVTRSIVDAIARYADTTKIKIIQTRIGDQATNRHDRIKYANKYNPDLLLTIHTNYDKDTTINGFELSYSDSTLKFYSPIDTINQKNPFANELTNYCNIMRQGITRNFPTLKQRKLAIRKDHIWMIYAGHYPSLLLEFGFITNRNDVAIMQNKKAITTLAKSLLVSLYQILNT